MESYCRLSPEACIQTLKTDKTQGLSAAEADSRKKTHGANVLRKKRGRSLLQMMLDQFRSVLILILAAAAVVSLFVGEQVDAVVILGIVVLNALMGFIQEFRAGKALEALQKMAAPMAQAVRDGSLQKIPAEELVPGDIIHIEAGSLIPADIRLLETYELSVQEAALTGESVPVKKDARKMPESANGEETALGDQSTMGFSGTLVTRGRAVGVVTATGMQSEIGKIAEMLNEHAQESSPLQKKLASFGKFLGIICLAVCVIIFILGLLRGEPLLEILMAAISLAVAAIPEGLPAVITVVLALGMQRMVSRHAVIKRLGAVETLGSTTVICTDKTGTLTQNKMSVVSAYADGVELTVSGTGYQYAGSVSLFEKDDDYEPESIPESERRRQHQPSADRYASPTLMRFASAAALCNDAYIDSEEENVIGDPTEGCLLPFAAKNGVQPDAVRSEHPRIYEFPFDSERKMMTTIHRFMPSGAKKNSGNSAQQKSGRQEAVSVAFTKGAPDAVIERCTHIMVDGRKKRFTKSMKTAALEINRKWAAQAKRVLAFAEKELPQNSETADMHALPQDQTENSMTFLGLTGAMDPPREEAKQAIALCRKAGIQVNMITGDHMITAGAVAKELGIIEEDAQVLSGSQLDTMNEHEFRRSLDSVHVFARVSPSHKVRIIDALHRRHEITAMTGDGVNDAPALNKADIGIAMGITGTDVTKEAADMILTDDNFSSIVAAVREGRIIFANIRKFVSFLLSCNIGELLLIFIAVLSGWPIPLLPIQLLWINLLTDSFPAFALGLEKGDKDIMDQPPRNPRSPIIDGSAAFIITLQSLALAAASLLSFRLGMTVFGDVSTGRTAAFITLILGELLRAYSVRSEKENILSMGIFSNRYLNGAVLIGIALLVTILSVPALRDLFHTAAPTLPLLTVSVLLSAFPLLAGELRKQFILNRNRNR